LENLPGINTFSQESQSPMQEVFEKGLTEATPNVTKPSVQTKAAAGVSGYVQYFFLLLINL